MDIQINTNPSGRRVNRYSDFRLDFSLLKNGEAYVPDSFIITFYVDDWNDCCSRYTVSLLEGVYTDCAVNGTVISAFFNSPRFNLGQLKCRVYDIVADSDFTDGTLDTCTPVFLPVQIVAGAGDTDTVVLDYGEAYFGNSHDLVIDGDSGTFGDNNNLDI